MATAATQDPTSGTTTAVSSWRRPPKSLVLVALAILVGIAAVGYGMSRYRYYAIVTQWHVPDTIHYDHVNYPLADRHHCYSRTLVAQWGTTRQGSFAGLALYVSLGAPPPDNIYLRPKGYDCLMMYYSSLGVG